MTELFRRFWKDCPYPVTLLTDRYEPDQQLPIDDVAMHANPTWCGVLCDFLRQHGDEPILMLLDDFFFMAPVEQRLIDDAVNEFERWKAGCIRLYPCPGADGEYGHERIGTVDKGCRYRIACQPAIWDPAFLYDIASRFGSAADFEIQGTEYALGLPQPILAFKRDIEPWPIRYILAIRQGVWNPHAHKLCEVLNISVDWSFRPMSSDPSSVRCSSVGPN